jgi:hypothetical protein
MKNKITCLLAGAALFGATANAEIVLTDDLSAYGYIDMALTDGDGTNDTDTAVAEFELGLSFTPAESKWSAVVELSFDSDSTTTISADSVAAAAAQLTDTFSAQDVADAISSGISTNSDTEFETVTITYQYSDTLSFTFGNILSYQGFETYDATGLYQFSYAGASNTPLYSAGYAVGASADGSVGDIDYGIWVGDTDSGTNSFEYLLAYNGIENLTIKAIIADDPGYDTDNIWASYDYGDFTFAVEYVSTDYVDNDGAFTYNDTVNSELVEEFDATVFMVYKAFGDAGLTLRYTDASVTVGGVSGDYEKTTISPSYAFSDNVFGLVEFSSEEIDGGPDQDSAAVELIYSF